MGEILFVADLHLDADRPETIGAFHEFLESRVPGASALYILGDFLDAWIGDDAPLSPELADMLAALRELSDGGLPIHFMHGNRDFLIGRQFAERWGLTLLDDPTVIKIHGQPVMLTHGDLLCTDDTAYQQFRAMVRDPRWQADFLAKPLEERQAIAQELRQRSTMDTGRKAAEIMDVNPAEVDRRMSAVGVDRLIHGHTHRPAIHRWDDRARIVLGDWDDGGIYLSCRPDRWALCRHPGGTVTESLAVES